jgi:hypothetical protein
MGRSIGRGWPSEVRKSPLSAPKASAGGAGHSKLAIWSMKGASATAGNLSESLSEPTAAPTTTARGSFHPLTSRSTTSAWRVWVAA